MPMGYLKLSDPLILISLFNRCRNWFPEIFIPGFSSGRRAKQLGNIAFL